MDAAESGRLGGKISQNLRRREEIDSQMTTLVADIEDLKDNYRSLLERYKRGDEGVTQSMCDDARGLLAEARDKFHVL